MKIEEMKAKLDRKKKLAVGLNLGGAGFGLALGAVIQKIVQNGLTEAALEKNKYVLDYLLNGIIDKYGKNYVQPYVDINVEPLKYLDALEANKHLIPNFDVAYSAIATNFKMRYNSLIKPDEILTQSIGVGVGAALVTWAIVAGYPTAKYLICKKKYNQSVKEYGELHEEITQ